MTGTAMGLLDLPPEVLSLVAAQLDPGDVMSLRKTCKYFHTVTCDKTAWMALFDKLADDSRYIIPQNITTLDTIRLTTAELEDLVLSVYLTNKQWQLPRKPPQHLHHEASTIHPGYPQPSSFSISAMNVLADRWLVVVHVGDAVEIWDLCPTSQEGSPGIEKSWRKDSEYTATRKLVFYAEIETISVNSAVTMDEHGSAIILAMSSQVHSKIMRIDLSNETVNVEYIAAFNNPSPLYTLRAIHAASQMLVFSRGLTLCFVHWPSHRFYTVPPADENDELWSGITGVTFLSRSHVLCVKTRSTDVYTLEDIRGQKADATSTSSPCSPSTGDTADMHNLGERSLRIHTHLADGTTFRGVSFSQPTTSVTPDTEIHSASFLAYDLLQGLFHYNVKVTVPRASEQPRTPTTPVPLDVSCTLAAAHHLVKPVAPTDILGNDAPSQFQSYTGSRTFVSACALGAQGKRGVWIERQRARLGRAVYGFAAASHLPVESVVREVREDAYDEGAADIAPVMDDKLLYEVQNSYDLRDDLTHCAFSEVTGKIVLGTRHGKLRLL